MVRSRAPIAPRSLGALVGRMKPGIGRLPLTYFEWVTAAALEHFARRGASPVILEVGLGGRLDAVNSVDARLALVTGIEREHTEFLGRWHLQVSVVRGLSRTFNWSGSPKCSRSQCPPVT